MGIADQLYTVREQYHCEIEARSEIFFAAANDVNIGRYLAEDVLIYSHIACEEGLFQGTANELFYACLLYMRERFVRSFAAAYIVQYTIKELEHNSVSVKCSHTPTSLPSHFELTQTFNVSPFN